MQTAGLSRRLQTAPHQEPMRRKRRASPSLRIISVMLAGLPALSRRGHVARPPSLTGAHIPVRAVRVLRTPTERRARYAPTQKQAPSHAHLHRRRGLTAARFKPTPLRVDRGEAKAGQQGRDRIGSPAVPRRGRSCFARLRKSVTVGAPPQHPESASGGPQAHADRDWKERASRDGLAAAVPVGRRCTPHGDPPFMPNRSCS